MILISTTPNSLHKHDLHQIRCSMNPLRKDFQILSRGVDTIQVGGELCLSQENILSQTTTNERIKRNTWFDYFLVFQFEENGDGWGGSVMGATTSTKGLSGNGWGDGSMWVPEFGFGGTTGDSLGDGTGHGRHSDYPLPAHEGRGCSNNHFWHRAFSI
jgi:hypothetical protein